MQQVAPSAIHWRRRGRQRKPAEAEPGAGELTIWVGLPAIRGAKSTSDMSYLDGLYRAPIGTAFVLNVAIMSSMRLE